MDSRMNRDTVTHRHLKLRHFCVMFGQAEKEQLDRWTDGQTDRRTDTEIQYNRTMLKVSARYLSLKINTLFVLSC